MRERRNFSRPHFARQITGNSASRFWDRFGKDHLRNPPGRPSRVKEVPEGILVQRNPERFRLNLFYLNPQIEEVIIRKKVE